MENEIESLQERISEALMLGDLETAENLNQELSRLMDKIYGTTGYEDSDEE